MPTRRVIVDHLTIGVYDLERSRRFYAQALAPLGFDDLGPSGDAHPGISFGTKDEDDFAISEEYEQGGQLHIAFAADSTDQVDAFHAAAIAAGGRDNGAPGPRPEYSDGYYGAFVLDPDGNNIEAVFHA